MYLFIVIHTHTFNHVVSIVTGKPTLSGAGIKSRRNRPDLRGREREREKDKETEEVDRTQKILYTALRKYLSKMA